MIASPPVPPAPPPFSSRHPVAEAFATVFRRPERLTVSQWADRYREMVDKEAIEPGRWRTSRSPYLRQIMDCQQHPAIRTITVKKAERVGGTEAIFNGEYYSIDRSPVNSLWVYPTQEVAQTIITERIIETILGCPQLAQHCTVRRRDIKTMQIALDRMTIRSFGSNAESKLEAMGYGRVVIDEYDRCESEVGDKVAGRVAQFPDSKVIFNGTPTFEGVGIAAKYLEGDRREYLVPCPTCGAFHIRTFSPHVRIPERPAGMSDIQYLDHVRSVAWFRCPNERCSAPIHGYQNMEQLRMGLWVPEACTIDRRADGAATVVHKDTGKEWTEGSTGSHASFWLRGLLSAFIANPYGYAAAKFVQKGKKATVQWSNRVLGEEWTSEGERLKASELKPLCIAREKGGYFVGTCPAPRGLTREMLVSGVVEDLPWLEPSRLGVMGLTAWADVQKDRIEVEVVGWSAYGYACFHIESVVLPRTLKDNLASLVPFIDRRWPLVDLRNGESLLELPLHAVAIDSGKWQDEAYAFSRNREARRVYVTKGYDKLDHGTKLIRWSRGGVIRRAKAGGGAGEIVDPGVPLLLMGVDHLKASVHDAIHATIGGGAVSSSDGEGVPMVGEAAELSGPGIHSTVRFPENVADEYFEQLTAEERYPQLVRGKTVYGWRLKKPNDRNEMLDCRVGNLALAHATKIQKLTVQYLVGLAQSTPRAAEPESRAATPPDRAAARSGRSGGGIRAIGTIGAKQT